MSYFPDMFSFFFLLANILVEILHSLLIQGHKHARYLVGKIWRRVREGQEAETCSECEESGGQNADGAPPQSHRSDLGLRQIQFLYNIGLPLLKSSSIISLFIGRNEATVLPTLCNCS